MCFDCSLPERYGCKLAVSWHCKHCVLHHCLINKLNWSGIKVPSEMAPECPSLHSIPPAPMSPALKILIIWKINTGMNQYTNLHWNHSISVRGNRRFYVFSCKEVSKTQLGSVRGRNGHLKPKWNPSGTLCSGLPVLLLKHYPAVTRSHRWAHEWPHTDWMISPYLPGSFNKCGSTQTVSYSRS